VFLNTDYLCLFLFLFEIECFLSAFSGLAWLRADPSFVEALQRRFVGEPGFGVGTGTIPDTDEYLTSTSLVLAGGKSTDEAGRRTKN
jgi:hypothetical protein